MPRPTRFRTAPAGRACTPDAEAVELLLACWALHQGDGARGVAPDELRRTVCAVLGPSVRRRVLAELDRMAGQVEP